MRGTWQTTDSGGGAPVLLVLGVLLLAASGGAVAGVEHGLFDALIAAVVAIFLLVVAVAAFVVRRARQEFPSSRGIVRMPVVHELPGPERPAIGTAAPRELHQHWHLHIGAGADPAAVAGVAEILRRDQRPE